MAEKFSAYLSIYNDWDILPETLRSIAPYIDECVVVDGAYEWMARYVQAIGHDPLKSDSRVYAALEGSGIPFRVISQLWPSEIEKRKAGYLACHNRYIYRIDADEIYAFNEAALSSFLSIGGGVGQMQIPLCVTPEWLVTQQGGGLEQVGFFFDSKQISADDHLQHLWLISGAPAGTTPAVPFQPPLSVTAHLTDWRTVTTSVNRAAFYVLNYYRNHGIPWNKEFQTKPLLDLSPLFARIPPDIFLDTLSHHAIVAGNHALNDRILRPSPFDRRRSEDLDSLFGRFLESQTINNVGFSCSGCYALGPVHLDVTTEAAARALSTGSELRFAVRPSSRVAQAFVRYVIPQEPWEIIRPLTAEATGDAIKLQLPFGDDEPAFVRRFLYFEAWAENGQPLLHFEPTGSSIRSGEDGTVKKDDLRTRLSPIADKAAAAGGTSQAAREQPPADTSLTSIERGPSRDEAKIAYLKQIRREFIDPISQHYLYRRFVEWLEQHDNDPHYPRFALTMAQVCNALPEMFANVKNLSILETGTLSLIAHFLRNQGCNVTASQSDLRYSINSQDKHLDLVLSLEVIAHIKDQESSAIDDIVLFNGSGAIRYIEELWRILKPGGVLVLTTPNPAGLSSLLNLINYEPPMVYRPNVREYTKNEIINLFSKFKLIKYESMFVYSYLGHGPDVAKEYAATLGWNPEDRGDCHFFVFRK